MTPEQLAALSAPVVRMIYMIRLDFDSGTLAWHSGYGDISYDGATYISSGDLGSISSLKEQPGIVAGSMSVTISGMQPEMAALIQTEPYTNRSALIYTNMLDDADQLISATPILFFRGTIDSISAAIGSTASIEFKLKSRLADWERKRTLRYTDSDQQRLYSGDKGMEFIPQMSSRQLIWPSAKFFPDARD